MSYSLLIVSNYVGYDSTHSFECAKQSMNAKYLKVNDNLLVESFKLASYIITASCLLLFQNLFAVDSDLIIGAPPVIVNVRYKSAKLRVLSKVKPLSLVSPSLCSRVQL